MSFNTSSYSFGGAQVHSHGSGGGGSKTNNGTPYTTLPPIFSARLGGSQTHRTHSNRSKTEHSGSHTSRDRKHLKAPLPEFRKKKDKNGEQIVAGASNGGGARTSSLANGGRKIASNADMRNGGQMRAKVGGQNGRQNTNSDEATIGNDGTVTFGPNLSLLMSSLAVRFDDTSEHEDGSDPGGHVRPRKGGGDAGGEDPLPSSLAVLTSRKRAEAKKREWNAMNALFSKAMEDKQTSKDQQQWFTSRFSYPLVHHPIPGGAGSLPPNVARAMANNASTSSLAGGLSGSPSQSNLDHHAHLLHTAARQPHAAAAVDQAHHAVSVEEEPEAEEYEV